MLRRRVPQLRDVGGSAKAHGTTKGGTPSLEKTAWSVRTLLEPPLTLLLVIRTRLLGTNGISTRSKKLLVTGQRGQRRGVARDSRIQDHPDLGGNMNSFFCKIS